MSFADLNLDPSILRALIEAGYENPTPIQAQSIPEALQGRDIMASAQTGTGKTAAFALPMLQICDPNQLGVQAIILEPTRELAVQVGGGIFELGRHTGLRVATVFGGQPFDRQIRALQAGSQIVVGTPGRLLDHIRRGTLDLSALRFVVLDEVTGQWIALIGAAVRPRDWLLAFLLFRAFDILKPPPARQFDRMHSGFGIMMDDVAAGVYAMLLVWLASRYI